MAQLREEAVPVISLVSDQSGFGFELSYEEIRGARADGISVLEFDRTI
jgi:hypothetical protein